MGTGTMIGHAVVVLVVGALVLGGYRWIQRQSQVIGAIVAVTVLFRLVIGQALFWISYLNLPIARSLQNGRAGFWEPTADAFGYFQMASRAVDTASLYPLDHVVPSPFFVNALAIWMYAVGVSPAAGMFLNLCLYLLIVMMFIRAFAPVNDWRRDLPCVVGVAAYSFAPVVMIHSTQPLKDELCTALIAMACFAIIGLIPFVRNVPITHPLRRIAASAIALGLATLGVTGIRWYYGLILWFALAAALSLFAIRGRRTSLLRYVTGSIAVLVVAGIGFRGGAGPYYRVVGANIDAILSVPLPRAFTVDAFRTTARTAIDRVAKVPADLALTAEVSRTGFLMSGGGTNVVVPLRKDAAAGLTRSSDLAVEEHETTVWQERFLQRRAAEQAEARAAGPPALRPSAPGAGTGVTTARQASVRPPESRPGVPPQPAVPAQSNMPPPAASEASRPEQAHAARAVPISIRDHVVSVVAGLAVVVAPISLVKAVFGIEVEGGRGMLLFADLDTVFLDGASFLVLGLLWTRRKSIGDHLPFVVFGLILSFVTALLLGYVVTNFGTLWRMRPLVVVPLWVLVVALSPRTEGNASPIGPQRSAPSQAALRAPMPQQ